MNDHYPPILVEATKDDILGALRDMHRQACAIDGEANPDISLSQDSTIADWRDACDLLPWKKLAEAMNSSWSVDIPLARWQDVLEPPKQRKMAGVCELLAQHAKLPRVRPALILGSRCTSGGTFLTIRSFLADAGADVSEVAPSTLLHEYTRRYPAVFLGPVSQLASGALPPVKIHTPVYDAFIGGMLIAFVALVIGYGAGSYPMMVLAGLVFALCYAGVWTIAQWVLPKSVEFQGLHTFRDLSKAIAAGKRA